MATGGWVYGVSHPSFLKIQLTSTSLCQAVLKPLALCSECNVIVTDSIHAGFRGFRVSNHRQEHTISIHFIHVGVQDWVRQFLKDFFPSAGPAPCPVCPPRWVKDALEACAIPLDDLFDALDLPASFFFV